MRPVFAPVVTLAAIALATAGDARGKFDLSVVRVCGPSACTETRDRAVRETLVRLFAPRADSLAPVPPVSAYHVVRGDERRGPPLGVVVVGSRAMRWGWPGSAPVWVEPGARVREELARLAGDVRPYAAPRPARVVVDGRLARKPAAFLPLVGPLERRPGPRASGPAWIAVTIVWNRANPWTEAASMFYDPDDRALYRGGAWYRVPPRLARLLTRR